MLLGVRISPHLLAGSLIMMTLTVSLTGSTSLSGCGDCTSCGSPYCFNLQTDSFNCGSCGQSCQGGEVCQNGQCARASCSVDGGCAGDAGTCCGATCCAFPDFCCTTSAGPACIQGGGESQCPP